MLNKKFITIGLLCSIIGIFFAVKYLHKNEPGQTLTLNKEKRGKMELKTDFSNNERIPSKYTCDGEDFSPELFVSDVPKGAKSLVLIVDDPDAPMGNFTHWLLYNIPPSVEKFSSKSLPKNSRQGANDFNRTSYGGPCPPFGVHRYFFKLYAIDDELNLKEKATKKELENAIKDKIIEKTELIGLYSRK